MNGTIAQIAALTCHLNARRRGMAIDRFFPQNSTCKFCEWIHFLGTQPGWLGKTGVKSPGEWIDSTIAGGMDRALLVHRQMNAPIQDRMSSGFIGGGGQWMLEVQQGERSEFWQARWQPGNKEAKDQRVWRVEYLVVAEGTAEKMSDAAVPQTATDLAAALMEIEAFARAHNLVGFADCFAKAQKCLTSDAPIGIYHRDLAPEGALTLEAARLLAACQAAWVFGGMGSWNDLTLDGKDQNLYQSCSDKLFDVLNRGICVAVNASAEPL